MEDDTQAFAWFKKAAEQQLMAAELNVAFDYENGRGVPQDKVQALMWLDLAEEQILSHTSGGAHISLVQRDKLAAQMSAAQIEQAKQLAAAWKADHSPLSHQSTP
jgi:TPR repeat protein